MVFKTFLEFLKALFRDHSYLQCLQMILLVHLKFFATTDLIRKSKTLEKICLAYKIKDCPDLIKRR